MISRSRSFSNDNGNGNEKATNLHIQWEKTIALHALHVRFSFLSISLPSSAKQRREIAKFEVLGFEVPVVLQRTAKKWTKLKIALAERAKLLLLLAKYANL